MKESDLLDKMSMVFGQMGDSSCSRSKAIYSGLTLAEYLRDEQNQDVLYTDLYKHNQKYQQN